MRNTPKLLPALAVLAALLPMVGSQPPVARAASTLRAGVAQVKITPSLERKVYIAGYDNNRVADSVHDDLWARALVLDDGNTRVGLVVCDLIGLSNYRVRRIRERVHALPGSSVIVCSTHVHSGPDTLGLWGPTGFATGVDPAYMAELEQNAAMAVDNAAKNLRPVTLAAGEVTVPDGLVHNSREPIQDKELTVLRFNNPAGKTVCSLINYGGHPEVNKSKAITSDYVHYVREAAEKALGGEAIFVNGALGGMVTPEIKEHTFSEMERVGVGVGEAAVRALNTAAPVADTTLRLQRKTVALPVENARFKLAAGAKILDTDLTDKADTEVCRFDLGPITTITIPGEILPKPALALKAKMPGKYKMIFALGNDELGYILDPDDFDKNLYKYEKSMSVGKQTWPMLFEAAQELLK